MSNQIIAVMLMLFVLIGAMLFYFSLPDWFSASQENVLALLLLFAIPGTFVVVLFKESVS